MALSFEISTHVQPHGSEARARLVRSPRVDASLIKEASANEQSKRSLDFSQGPELVLSRNSAIEKTRQASIPLCIRLLGVIGIIAFIVGTIFLTLSWVLSWAFPFVAISGVLMGAGVTAGIAGIVQLMND